MHYGVYPQDWLPLTSIYGDVTFSLNKFERLCEIGFNPSLVSSTLGFQLSA